MPTIDEILTEAGKTLADLPEKIRKKIEFKQQRIKDCELSISRAATINKPKADAGDKHAIARIKGAEVKYSGAIDDLNEDIEKLVFEGLAELEDAPPPPPPDPIPDPVPDPTPAPDPAPPAPERKRLKTSWNIFKKAPKPPDPPAQA